MHLVTTLTMLLLASLTAFLVVGLDWSVFQAGLVVTSITLVGVLLPLAAVWLWSDKSGRKVIWNAMRSTMKQDFADFLRLLGLKK